MQRKYNMQNSFSGRYIHSFTGATAVGRALRNEYEVTAYVSGHEHNHRIQYAYLF